MKNRTRTVEFNDRQLEAINAPDDRPILCLAGPGSGKTLVLVHRAAHLIGRGVDPENMLLTTFTRKAADEIKKRLAAFVGSAAADRVLINTIHGTCLGLLRDAGNKKQVITPGQSKRIIRDVLSYKRLDWAIGWKAVFNYINDARFDGCMARAEAEEYYSRVIEDRGTVRRLSDAFRYYMDTKPGIDFVDMIMLVWHRLSEDGMFTVANQRRFSHILIDELQDTSRRSFEILRTLARPQDKVFGVGDPDQELFRWNGADPDHNVFGFPGQYHNTRVIKLEINYRSTEKIIAASNRLIRHNYAGDDSLLKVLKPRPDAEAGEDPISLSFNSEKEEAGWVVEEIQSLLAGGWDPGQMFVVMRTNAQSRSVEDALVRHRIPYVIAGNVGFYGRKHVKDIIAFLKLMVDRHDNGAFKRVANKAAAEYFTHFRGFGQAFYRDCKESGSSLWDGMLNLADEYDSSRRSGRLTKFKRAGIQDFVDQMSLFFKADPPQAAIGRARIYCYDSWYMRDEGLSRDDEAEGSVFNDLDELQYAAGQFSTIPEFLAHVKEMQDLQRQTEKVEAEAVVLTTIHKVKGLERDIVFLIGFSNNLLPHYYSLGATNNADVELPPRRLTGVKDERCAAFVAVSRAKQICYLSTLQSYRGKPLEPSMFLGEILGERDE